MPVDLALAQRGPVRHTGANVRRRAMCVAAHGGRAPDRWQEEGLSVSEAPTYHNYIGGEWIPTSTGAVGENRNPATGDLIGYFPRSAQADVDRAVAAAAEAYRSWRTYPAPRRGEILYRVGEILIRRFPPSSSSRLSRRRGCRLAC